MPRKFKTLDVRPILAHGVEPFAKIRESIDALGPMKAFRSSRRFFRRL